MRKKRYIRHWFPALLWVMLCAVSCSKDPKLTEFTPDDGKTAITLRVVMPDPVIENPMTRAGAADFDRINDLNIIVAEGGNDDSGVSEVHYVNGSQAGDPAVDMEEGKEITIHFSEEYTSLHGLVQKKFYIVANYGSKIDVATVGDLKALKQESPAEVPGIPVGCMMFAEARNAGTHLHPDTGKTGLSLSAELERTVAMLTVEVDGSELNAGISVSPRRISLHRVPQTCYLGKANSPYTDPALHIVDDGEQKGSASELNWPMVVGRATLDPAQGETPAWAASAKISAGGHYPEDDGNSDFSDQTVAPLFMFENDHGGDSFGHEGGMADQTVKRPAACRMTGNWAELLDDKSTATCSYLEVEALYMRRNDDGTTRYGGIVRFRFFLGDDAVRNFDVLRNHYYKITLKLKGNAVTEGGQVDENGELIVDGDQITWRVESNLRSVVIETGDIIVGGSGEYYPIDISGLDSDTVYPTTQNMSCDRFFVYAFNDTGDGEGSWVDLGSSAGMPTQISTDEFTGKPVLWIYIAPWVPDPPSWVDLGFDDDGSRRCDFVLYSDMNGRDELARLSIVQYAPIEYEASGDYIEEAYNRQSITMYIDRVDREAMPWGVDGVKLDHNAKSGYDNTYHLIEEGPFDSEIYPEHGDSHREKAEIYLPWGKQNGGSALIYATTLWHLPTCFNGSRSIPSINALLNDTSFPNHESDNPDNDDETHLHWTVPSILGWQVIEKASKDGALDPSHPVFPYMQYWTSNAVVADPDKGGDGYGTKDSYTYQFGRGLDTIKETDEYPADLRQDRSIPMRFRLVAIKDQ